MDGRRPFAVKGATLIMSTYKLCERCTVRNCRRKPTWVDHLHEYRCRKRIRINDKLSNVLEIILAEHDVLPVYDLLDRAGLNVIKNNRGRLITAPKGG